MKNECLWKQKHTRSQKLETRFDWVSSNVVCEAPPPPPPLPSAGLSVIRFSRKNRMSSMSSKEIKYSLHCDDVRGNTDEGGLDYKRRHFYTLLTSVFVCTTLDAVTSLSSRQQCKNACKHSVMYSQNCLRDFFKRWQKVGRNWRIQFFIARDLIYLTTDLQTVIYYLTNHCYSTLHTKDNKFAFSNQEKADALNNFFISLSMKLIFRHQILTVGLSLCHLKFEFPNPKSKTS